VKLKDYLINNLITEKKFADQLGVKQPTVSRYLHNLRIPKKNILNKIREITQQQVTESDFPTQVHWKQRGKDNG